MKKILLLLLLINISLYAYVRQTPKTKNYIGVIVSQNKTTNNDLTKDEISYGISYKWESGGNLFAGIQTDIYKKDEDYISDVFPFIGLRITKNMKINCFYGYNLLYNNESTSGDLYGGTLSYELSDKYEIGINYKEIDNNENKIESTSLFFNFKIK